MARKWASGRAYRGHEVNGSYALYPPPMSDPGRPIKILFNLLSEDSKITLSDWSQHRACILDLCNDHGLISCLKATVKLGTISMSLSAPVTLVFFLRTFRGKSWKSQEWVHVLPFPSSLWLLENSKIRSVTCSQQAPGPELGTSGSHLALPSH